MMDKVSVSLTINGETVSHEIEPRMSLGDFLRMELNLTGTHLGCEHGVCGACSVRVNGEVIRGCLLFAVQADGAEIVTIEGLTASGEISDLQNAFKKFNSLQCGFCTPGMLMSAAELMNLNPHAGRAEIRDFISGNFCRCTGYQSIVDAIEETLVKRRKEPTP